MTSVDHPAPAGLPRHNLEVPEPATLPFAIGSFDRIGPLSRAPFPHRHTFYEFVHVTGGAGAHVVDLDERELHPPQVCVIAPGQTHYWRQSARLEGHVVLFTDDFLLTHPGDRDALYRLGGAPGRQLTAEESGRIQGLVASMEREHRRRAPGFRGVLQAYLHILIVETGRLHHQAPAGRRAEPAVALAKRFQKLIDDRELLGSSVPAYATRLGVSAGYLNDMVRQALGASPGHVIRQARALEAKRLLAGTTLSVTQVAGQLGFADAAYFCRFFRREVGDTPGGFRQRLRRTRHDGDGDG
ncbi:AraC family transcriptional regulator [Amorphoplanes nipponensis]|uniref:AraC family transcriptional regulator n=1 Tax=Actinoplanes nipponensis TaxID=135950 RepID=A0A919JBC8_9ACTN|nr:helix-turn-helix domain-containing protein [Actinoplanes nipponensis]GIE47231.1 AraC family transcriptional regulator [Actinoplanes nipponensis]